MIIPSHHEAAFSDAAIQISCSSDNYFTNPCLSWRTTVPRDWPHAGLCPLKLGRGAAVESAGTRNAGHMHAAQLIIV